MGVVVLPSPQPVFDRIVQGYYPEFNADQGDIARWNRGALGLETRIQAQGVPRTSFGFGQGGTGVNESIGPYRGDFAVQRTDIDPLGATVVNAYGGLSCMPITDITGLAAGYTNPSWRRVCWMTIRVAQDAGVLDEDDGMVFIPFGAAQVGDVWPTAGTNHGGFGILPDGAGAWQWGSYGLGAFPGNRIETVPLPVPDPQDWNQFDLVVVSGAPGRQASVEVFVNGVSALTRTWVGGADPNLNDYAATEFAFHPVWRIGTTTNDTFLRAAFTFRNGRFLPSGVELLA